MSEATVKYFQKFWISGSTVKPAFPATCSEKSPGLSGHHQLYELAPPPVILNDHLLVAATLTFSLEYLLDTGLSVWTVSLVSVLTIPHWFLLCWHLLQVKILQHVQGSDYKCNEVTPDEVQIHMDELKTGMLMAYDYAQGKSARAGDWRSYSIW